MKVSERESSGKPRYNSPLREAQTAATRTQILEAMATLIEAGAEPTYAAVAVEAGVQERTVYRHFPSKDDLYEAFWWQVLDSRLGKTGYDATDVVGLQHDIDVTFHSFGQNEAIVREMLHSKFGLAIRMRTNDRRREMFLRVARHELPDADDVTLRQAAAMAQLLYSGAAWQDLADYWDMDADESVATVHLALEAMFDGLRAATTAPSRSRT